MLNPFPELLDFTLAAPLFIRIFAGLYFLLFGYLLFRGNADDGTPFKHTAERVAGGLALLGGAFLVVGFLTQIAAAVLALLSLWNVYASRNPTRRALFLMLFAMTISLLFSGAGFFAFDLPL